MNKDRNAGKMIMLILRHRFLSCLKFLSCCLLLAVIFISFAGCSEETKAKNKFKKLVQQEDEKIKDDLNKNNHTIELACCEKYLGVSSYKIYKTDSDVTPYEGEITFKCYNEPNVLLQSWCWREHELTHYYQYYNNEGGWSRVWKD
jgi:hypothetical protein